MIGSYKESDVVLLLKDITGQVEPLSTEVREKLIQSGVHYSEMLPIEYKPTKDYMDIYNSLLELTSKDCANAVGVLATKLISERGKDIVLVSLARAGIPIGILLKRYIKFKYDIDVPHYAISIIRGRGIDKNAMNFLLKKYDASSLVFVDGWTGKGAIKRQLDEALKSYDGVSSDLAVLSDPAGVARYYGTREDILIPSSCLNSTVSGLISRTFYREDIIKGTDYHGVVVYDNLKDCDLSYSFIKTIENEFSIDTSENVIEFEGTGLDEVKALASEYNIKDINLIKPSIGETTRVLLRRVPWKVLINTSYRDDKSLKPILQLAHEKHVPIEYKALKHYKACGLIKELSDI